MNRRGGCEAWRNIPLPPKQQEYPCQELTKTRDLGLQRLACHFSQGFTLFPAGHFFKKEFVIFLKVFNFCFNNLEPFSIYVLEVTISCSWSGDLTEDGVLRQAVASPLEEPGPEGIEADWDQ